jgi:hypothetical protein
MPTWNELQSRNPSLRAPKALSTGDEVLVADQRGRMSPGHFVEQKLRMALTVERPRRRSPK